MTHTEKILEPIRYDRSFLAGTWLENQVRFWVESRMTWIDEHSGLVEHYIQCAACKSEDTFAERELLSPDNYHFTPIFGPEYGIIFRRKAKLNPQYKSTPLVANMWGGPLYKLQQPTSCTLLETNEAIREATHAGIPLVAQTEIWNDATGLRAIIEHPVKTMNIHDARNLYQTDTGPILYPDLSLRAERVVDTISLAYSAFNVPTFTDFVLEVPTDVAPEGGDPVHIHHYSQLLSLPAINRLYAVE